jgi:23S rRNA pseudouridine1911/1915/1917 synthase
MGNEGTGARRVVLTTGGRLDASLAGALPGLSRARIQRLIAAGDVTVGDTVARKAMSIPAGTEVVVHLREREILAPWDAAVVDIPCIYEDDDVVAINKPAGLPTHGGPGDEGPSVAAWFVARYPAEAAAFDVDRPGIVHRLDKDTSGVLLLAKTPAAQAALSHSFEAREVTKVYLAVCDGVPARERAVIDAPIARHPGDRTKMAIVKRGREARSEYRVLASDGRRSLLQVQIFTGRTHQVRVHLAAIGCPVMNDHVYGRAGDGRQLLHAWRLGLAHPSGGRIELAAPLPADLAEVSSAIDASMPAALQPPA